MWHTGTPKAGQCTAGCVHDLIATKAFRSVCSSLVVSRGVHTCRGMALTFWHPLGVKVRDPRIVLRFNRQHAQPYPRPKGYHLSYAQ